MLEIVYIMLNSIIYTILRDILNPKYSYSSKTIN